MSNQPETISGAKFRQARKALGLTQVELAQIFRVSKKHISDLELGKAKIHGHAELALECLLRRQAELDRHKADELVRMMHHESNAA